MAVLSLAEVQLELYNRGLGSLLELHTRGLGFLLAEWLVCQSKYSTEKEVEANSFYFTAQCHFCCILSIEQSQVPDLKKEDSFIKIFHLLIEEYEKIGLPCFKAIREGIF